MIYTMHYANIFSIHMGIVPINSEIIEKHTELK